VGTNRHACTLYGGLPVKDQSGYLMPGGSPRSTGGTSSCPWLIRARPGQRVNLTLFNLDRQHHSPAMLVCNHKTCSAGVTVELRRTISSGGFRPGPGGTGSPVLLQPPSFVVTHNFYARQQNTSCVFSSSRRLSVSLSVRHTRDLCQNGAS